MNRRSYNFLREQQETVQIRRITDWNRTEFSAFLQNPEAYDRTSNAAVAFGAYQNDIPAGAVELVTEEGYIELWSIFVDEECRRCGIGSALLDKAKEFAAEMDVDQIQAELINDSHDASVKAFFETGGFYLSGQEGTILSFRPAALLPLELMQKMASCGLPKDAVALDQLSRECKYKLAQAKNRFGSNFFPRDVGGRIRKEASFGCPDEKNGLGAYLLFAQRGDAVCLVSVYTDTDHITPFLRLLAHALKILAAQGVEELYVTAKNEAFLRIMQKITEEEPELLRSRTMERMSWNLEDARLEMEAGEQARAMQAGKSAEEGAEILVPRLMRLVGILEAMDVSCDLMLSDIPYIMVENRISVSYHPEDDTYERFELAFCGRIARETQEEAEKTCIALNNTCRYAAAIPADGDILIRYAVPEYGSPIDEELFLSCLDAFRRDLALAGMYL